MVPVRVHEGSDTPENIEEGIPDGWTTLFLPGYDKPVPDRNTAFTGTKRHGEIRE